MRAQSKHQSDCRKFFRFNRVIELVIPLIVIPCVELKFKEKLSLACKGRVKNWFSFKSENYDL
jgi:hypothetical protein